MSESDINITPTRLAVLRAIEAQPGMSAQGIARKCVQRPAHSDGTRSRWRAQGAALVGGSLVRPLERAGLVLRRLGRDYNPDEFVITPAGRKAIKDSAARAAMEALVEFAESSSPT